MNATTPARLARESPRGLTRLRAELRHLRVDGGCYSGGGNLAKKFIIKDSPS